ncbi:MAG: GxxExxY protein [Candidatus Edwardsbacteria bacterium]|nr:GxxExxY protein [Candidatus Edwardsbacteria bacterium]
MEKDERTAAIIGAATEVHRILGPGRLEAVYHEALQIEFELRQIPYVSKPRLELYYKGRKLEKYYEPDFFTFGEIVVEIKAQSAIGRACTPKELRPAGG